MLKVQPFMYIRVIYSYQLPFVTQTVSGPRWPRTDTDSSSRNSTGMPDFTSTEN